jgi:hypothetical protein
MFADYTYFGVTRQLEFVSAAMKFISQLRCVLPGNFPAVGAVDTSIRVERHHGRRRMHRFQ